MSALGRTLLAIAYGLPPDPADAEELGRIFDKEFGVRERNLRVVQHEAETPMDGHDANGRCCLRAAFGTEGDQ